MTREAAPAEQDVEHWVRRAIEALDFQRARQEYREQNECLLLPHFLPPEIVECHLVPEVDKLRPNIHRNYIPGHKKGGSISYWTLAEKAPLFLRLYTSRALIDFLSRLAAAPLQPCPDDDPHACALATRSQPLSLSIPPVLDYRG